MVKKRSDDINIPLDLMVEILEKLPAKSLARFRCVSSQWQSIINKFIVIDSIVTRCSAQSTRDPHFIIYKRSPSQYSSIFSFAYVYHQITNEEQLCHEEIFGKSKGYLESFQYVRGLIGFWCLEYYQFTIHNPTTKQSRSLPIRRLPLRGLFYLFGYEPSKNQYKVLCLTRCKLKQSCKVFILGDPSEQWRDIECNIGSHTPFGKAVCINGKIYYKARTHSSVDSLLVSFDVRSEKFNHIQAPEDLPINCGDYSTLINNQGKLGCISRNKLNENDVDFWVMENGEKQEWSKVTYISMLQDLPNWIQITGVTHPGGEIVIVHQNYLSELAFDVHYYDPRQKSRRRVEILATSSVLRVRPSDVVNSWAVTDHVENIMHL